MPSTRQEPFDHLIDQGSFRRASDALAPRDPIVFPKYENAIAASRASSGIDESVQAGAATIGGHDVELASFDFSFFGGSMGEVAGERIARTIERAAERGVPFVLRSATGGARMQEGMLSLIQMPKLIAARVRLSDAHLPYIAILGDPTTGGVLASIGALADVTIAERGATVGFAGPRVVEMVTGSPPSPDSHTAASAFGNGMVDVVIPVLDVRNCLRQILGALSPDTPEDVPAPASSEREPLDAWDAVQKSRAEKRPTALAIARQMGTSMIELHGDRAGRDDPALLAALTRVRGRRVALLALDRTSLLGPAAFRKARRALSIATRLKIPVVTLVDTRGADPSEGSEAGGIAWEIAALFDAMLSVPVPIVACVTGEGGSGGALAFATGDVLLAYEHSIFSVIGPEAAATILWRDPGRAPDAARSLRLTAGDLKRLGIADSLLPEPLEAGSLADAVAYHLDRIEHGSADFVNVRRTRWRNLG